ncbi:Retrovirus-related Pol polyprotein from transposon TNT 1-94 [Cucumis melo var. makuwa]|uniref:Retrovirus-related Pol polyprotein from transposon TNT 1-94 n=1 Tax=Cucumis melo var. makuwa TaxID=1194695 RepID=A0A5D3C373_CUCMM|nr:Retrovirus-related Pol polyprotein from transposon TNT 1-94 [Cucumis melo var. makuwa]
MLQLQKKEMTYNRELHQVLQHTCSHESKEMTHNRELHQVLQHTCIAIQLMGFTNAKDLWEATQDLFGVQSRAEEDFLRQMFQTTRKVRASYEDYLRIMKTNSDKLGQAGSPVPKRAFISQALLGLDEVYNPVIAVIQGKPEISWIDMQSELLTFEKRLEHQDTQKNTENIIQNVVNIAQNRNSSDFRKYSNHQFHGNNRNNSQGQRGGFNIGRGRGKGRGNKPTCQVCEKYGHSALVCYNRFNKEFLSPLVQDRGAQSSNFSKHSNLTVLVTGQSVNQFATADTVINLNWYIDSGATNHLTVEYSNLSNPSEYSGIEKIMVGNGDSLHISYIGNAYLTDGINGLNLKNVLCVPDITKNLVSVSKLAQDNNVYIEFHGCYCFIKDKDTGRTLLNRTIKDGLYHLDTIRKEKRAEDLDCCGRRNSQCTKIKVHLHLCCHEKQILPILVWRCLRLFGTNV